MRVCLGFAVYTCQMFTCPSYYVRVRESLPEHRATLSAVLRDTSVNETIGNDLQNAFIFPAVQGTAGESLHRRCAAVFHWRNLPPSPATGWQCLPSARDCSSTQDHGRKQEYWQNCHRNACSILKEGLLPERIVTGVWQAENLPVLLLNPEGFIVGGCQKGEVKQSLTGRA